MPSIFILHSAYYQIMPLPSNSLLCRGLHFSWHDEHLPMILMDLDIFDDGSHYPSFLARAYSPCRQWQAYRIGNFIAMALIRASHNHFIFVPKMLKHYSLQWLIRLSAVPLRQWCFLWYKDTWDRRYALAQIFSFASLIRFSWAAKIISQSTFSLFSVLMTQSIAHWRRRE